MIFYVVLIHSERITFRTTGRDEITHLLLLNIKCMFPTT